MTPVSLLQLGSWILAAFAGAIAHEVAHWLVWRVTGRRPELDLWGLTVIPHAGPAHATPGDRVAAAAPYVVGLSCCLSGVVSGEVLWVVFGVGMVQLPSRADLATMRGDVTWRSRDVEA